MRTADKKAADAYDRVLENAERLARMLREDQVLPHLPDADLENLTIYLVRNAQSVAQSQRAGILAGRRAEPSRQLGKIVGGFELLPGSPPIAFADQRVPFRNLVMHGTVAVAPRHTAVHAARALVGSAGEIALPAKDAGQEVEVPFAPGRTDATQEQTDVGHPSRLDQELARSSFGRSPSASSAPR